MAKAYKDKRQLLLEAKKKAEDDLRKLDDKRKKEIGEIAYRCGLEHADDTFLKTEFGKLAKALNNGDA